MLSFTVSVSPFTRPMNLSLPLCLTLLGWVFQKVAAETHTSEAKEAVLLVLSGPRHTHPHSRTYENLGYKYEEDRVKKSSIIVIHQQSNRNPGSLH